MAEKAGYQIGRRFFPFPTSFRMLDSVLIHDVTGMDWDEFVGAMPDDDDPEDQGNPIVMAGMLAVAIWHENPMWRRDKVVRFIQGVNIEDVEVVGLDEETEGAEGEDASPPEEEAPVPAAENGSKDLEKPVEKSDLGLASPSGQSSQKLSGSQLSATTPK